MGSHIFSGRVPTMNKVKEIVGYFAPRAQEVVQRTKEDATTRDGHGVVLNALLRFPNDSIKMLFLAAVSQQGYPMEKAKTIAQLMGQENRFLTVMNLLE